MAVGLAAVAFADSRDATPPLPSKTGSETSGHRSDAVIVRLAPGIATVSKRAGRIERVEVASLETAARELGGAWFEREFPGDEEPLAEFLVAHLPAGTAAAAAIARFETAAGVTSAFPIAWMPAAAIPNDSLWSAAYYFRQPSRRDIHAPEAWDVTVGDTAIVVGIVDTGVYYDHPDLAGQIWTNWSERTGTAGVDDDGNGFVDDDRGWDFVDQPQEGDVRPGEDLLGEDNDPNDFAGHGTAVAGLVGARTNNGIGVAGTAWRVRLMPLRVGWSTVSHPSGIGDVSYMARAIRYATRMGAQVINCSFTTTNQPDLAVAVDLATAAGVTVVTASGNFAITHYLAQREDVISVTGTDPDDVVLGYVTQGPTVDIAAAGSRLATTTLDRDTLGNRWPDYTTGASGTSFSAPLVAGAVALMQAQRLEHGERLLTPFEARLRLMDTADDIAAQNLGSGGYGTGRLNLYRALTDPPASVLAETRARPVGPGVALPSSFGSGLVAIATDDARLLMLDATTGATIRSVSLFSAPVGGIAAANLGTGSGIGLFVASQGKLHGFNADLEQLPGWPVVIPTSTQASSREPVLADLDGDEIPEVLWCGGLDGAIRTFSIDGRPFGPPIQMAGGSDVQIAVSDLDGIPGVEIVACAGSFGRVLRSNGTLLPNWIALPGTTFAPMIARLGRDSVPTVLVAGANAVSAITRGALRWRTSPPGSQTEAPIAADLDGDGGAEIVLLRSFPTPLVVLDSTGAVLRGWQSPALTNSAAGPPLAGPVGPRGNAILLSSAGSGLRAFDPAGNDIRIFPKPGGGGAMPFIADIDGDGHTEVVAGSFTNSDLLFYDSGPGTWSARPGVWLAARANFARTGSLLYSPPLGSPSRPRPAAISDLAVTASDARGIELRWTAPATAPGDSLTRYELRVSRTPFDSDDFFHASAYTALPLPGPAGSETRVFVTGLEELTRYYFAVRTREAPGNWSDISNLVAASTLSVPPAPVSDLHAGARSDTTMTLEWTASGNDDRTGRPRLYRLRAAEAPLDSASFASAPFAWDLPAQVEAGLRELAVVPGVPLGRHLWFAMVAVDSAGNASSLSNAIDVVTTPFPPAAVADLRGVAERQVVARLRWTSSGEDGTVGRPRSYLVRASETPIDEAAFDAATSRWEFPAHADAGGSESALLEGLQARRYWIALKARDGSGNLSPLSNALALVIDTPPGAVADLSIVSQADTEAVLGWTATGADGSVGRPALYQLRAFEYAGLDQESFDLAPWAWETPARSDPGGRESIVLTHLVSEHTYYLAVAAVDAGGNRGAISNVILLQQLSIPPAPMSVLSLAERTDTTLTLQWTATGEDGQVGRPRSYSFRADTRRITPQSFASAPIAWEVASTVDAGGNETHVFAGFQPNGHYYLAAVAVDAVGNRSALSPNLEFTLVQTPPAAVQDLRVAALADTSFTLAWTATGEDGEVGRPRDYRIRAAETPLDAQNFDSAPFAWEFTPTADGGGQESVTLSGLTQGHHYWVSLVADDRNHNASPIAANAQLTSGPVPPAAVSGLAVSAESDSGVTLEWVASGEDDARGRATAYAIRASEQAIDDSNFDQAPFHWEIPGTVDAGGTERATLSGFTPNRRQFVAIAAIDRFGNRSSLQVLEVITRRYLPAAISDLELVTQGPSAVVLRWTASGEDGVVGRATSYLVRAARAPLDSASFGEAPLAWEIPSTVDAGGEERASLTEFESDHRWWVGVVAIDRVGNASPLSNVRSFWLGRLAEDEGGALEVESQPSRAPVRFLWRARAGDANASRSIRVYDLAGRLVRALELGLEEGGVAVWDGSYRDGLAAPAAVYFARLVIGGATIRTRVVLIR